MQNNEIRKRILEYGLSVVPRDFGMMDNAELVAVNARLETVISISKLFL